MKKSAKVTETLDTCLDEYLIHKTYRGYPAILNDIDVLVPSLDKALKSLLSQGMTVTEFDQHSVMLISNGQKVHLHDKISWANSTFLDSPLIYERPRSAKLWNVKVRIPNVEADFLIFMAHINFEPLHFTISDFIYLCTIAPLVDWKIILSQAKKFHWIRTLTHTLLLFDQLYQKIYCGSSPFGTLKRTAPPVKNGSLSFPVMIPRRLVISAFLEKGLFGYLARKISKCAHILLTGDTYKVFYEPPEQNLTLQNTSEIGRKNP